VDPESARQIGMRAKSKDPINRGIAYCWALMVLVHEFFHDTLPDEASAASATDGYMMSIASWCFKGEVGRMIKPKNYAFRIWVEASKAKTEDGRRKSAMFWVFLLYDYPKLVSNLSGGKEEGGKLLVVDDPADVIDHSWRYWTDGVTLKSALSAGGVDQVPGLTPEQRVGLALK
jgi:hypothetical protein